MSLCLYSSCEESSRTNRHSRTKRKLQCTLYAAIVTAMFFGLCSAQFLAIDREHQPFVPAITISKETTWATEPITEEGLVDYQSVLNQQSCRGVTPENNAVVVLSRALGPKLEGTLLPDRYYELLGIEPLPEAGPYFESSWNWWERNGNKLPPGGWAEFAGWDAQMTSRPWAADEFPEFSKWLAEMEAPLQLAVEASKRTEFFSPLCDDDTIPLVASRMSFQATMRELCGALVSRAMLRLGNQNQFEAWEDLHAAHRLARLLGRGPFLFDAFFGCYLESQVVAGELRLIAETQPSRKFTRQYLKQLRRLPPISPIIGKIDTSERAAFVDVVQRVAWNRVEPQYFLEDSDHTWHDKFVENGINRQVDWDEILKAGNRRFDQLNAALSQPTYRQREAALHAWDDEFKMLTQRRQQATELFTTLEGKPALTSLASDVLAVVRLPHIRELLACETKCSQRLQSLEIALALSAWRGEHDSYPESLAELAPGYLTSVPFDLFSDQPLCYERTSDGYRFYSFGVNGTDDHGRNETDMPMGDDLAVQMPMPWRKP